MKTNGKTFIILGITFILCSAIWFLWVRNIAMGIVWLAIGILEVYSRNVILEKQEESAVNLNLRLQ